MRVREVTAVAAFAVFVLLFGCGDGCGNDGDDGEADNVDNSFTEPVGEWTPETCEGGEDEDGDGAVDCIDPDCYAVQTCAFDPSGMNAAELPTNGILSLWERSRWMFAEGGPQRGVADGAITPQNIGTVSGRVLNTDGEPLAGASIAFASHPDLGRTYTRADGSFDLAFDAGRRLVLRVAAADHIISDRRLIPRVQQSTSVDEIVLVPHENEGTPVDLSTTTYVTGTQRSDDDGARTTAAIIPKGTRAKLVFPNGASRPIEELHVRATEVTVGERGPQAMMAELPPGTLYTYAAEFTVDEASAENASGVEFDSPVFLYVDNFLGFEPGTLVPSGFYDRSDLNWEAMPDGIVVEVTDVGGGKATLSIGDGQMSDAAKERLGVTDDELQLLAEHYDAGDTLWRVPTRHFSPYDFNWPGPFPPGTAPPPDPGEEFPPQCTSVQEDGSFLGCSNQTLSERIPLNGTPFTLTYQSGRVSGRKPVVEVPIIPNTASTVDLRAARVRVTVAGRQLADEVWERTDVPRATEFIWDGRDQFGRKLQGSAEVEIEVALIYHASYAGDSARGSELPSAIDDDDPAFGGYPVEGGVTVELGRAFVTVRRVFTRTLTVGTYDVAREGLGGWTLDAQHRYDPIGRVMYYGNGQDLPAGPDSEALELVSGYSTAIAGPGDPTTAERVRYAGRPVIANDGVIFFTPANQSTVAAIEPLTNKVTTVVGQRDAERVEEEQPTDGVVATEKTFNAMNDIRYGKDSRLYLRSEDWVWRLESDGTLSVLVGSANDAYGSRQPRAQNSEVTDVPDGARALDVAGVWQFYDATADGTLYLGTKHNIYRRTADGRIRHVAPVEATCQDPPCGDGASAMTTPLGTITGLAVSRDGDVYFSEETGSDDFEEANVIRRIRADGILETLATVPPVVNLEVGPGDRVYFAPDVAPSVEAGESPHETSGAAVVQLTDEGELVARAGLLGVHEGFTRPIVDGESAARPLRPGFPFAISPSGQVVFIGPDSRIVKLRQLLPPYTGGKYEIPRPNGNVVDEFAPSGRHLGAHDALTGVELRSFEYDDIGRLLSSADAEGDVTEVRRDPDGNPTTIVGPDGVTWEMEVEDGVMTRLTSPEGDEWTFGYDDGLMTAMTNPRGESWSFAYDEAGRLVEDTGPDDNASTLERDPVKNSVLFTSAEGRQTLYQSTPPTSPNRFSSMQTGDLEVVTSVLGDGWSRTSTQDGTVRYVRREAHPVYGMIAGYDAESLMETPSGLHIEGTASQWAEVSEGDLLAGLDDWRADRTLGEGTVNRVWDRTEKTLTVTTGEGRGSTVTLDDRARPSIIEAPGVEPLHYTYDEQGRLDTVTQGTRVTSMGYDENGYLASVTTDDGTALFSRDLMGRIKEATRPDRSVVDFGWDSLGNLTGVTAPGRATAYEMTHDDRGRLLTMRTPAGHETYYRFDADHRPTGMVLADGRETSITYDDSDRVDSVELDGAPVDYGYADTGQLESVTGGDADLTMTWDGPLLLTRSQDGVASGTIGYSWEDGTLNLASLEINGTEVDYTYDSDGFPLTIGSQKLDYQPKTSFVRGRELGEVDTNYEYNEFGELSQMRTRADGTEILERLFTYDSLGRVVEIEETNQGATTTYTYGYDLIGQLVQVEATGDQTFTHTYGYDENGNRTAVSNGTDTLTVGEIDYDVDDRLTKYGTATFAYNDAGQLASKTNGAQTTEYVYGVSGELQQVTLPSGQVVEYEHDALQRRVARKVDGAYTHRFLYGDNINPIAEVDASGNTISAFVYGTGVNVPDAMIRGGTTYYFVRDHLGSVRFVVDTSDGSIAQELRYDEFGQVVFDSNAGFQPFGYAGGLYDPDTGLVRFGARDFDPQVGRWTAPDPIGFDGGQANLYAYVQNAPVSTFDPSGTFVWVAAGAGALSNGLTNGISVWSSGGSFWGGVAVGATTGLLLGIPWSPQVTGALIGTTTSLGNDLLLKDDCDPVDAGLNAVIGGGTGAILGVGTPVLGRAASRKVAQDVVTQGARDAIEEWIVGVPVTIWTNNVVSWFGQ